MTSEGGGCFGTNDKKLFIVIKKQKLTKLAKRYGLRFGAARFVAGETIDEAVSVIKS